jgi:RHH-type transcriptional regulator, rel operon repressor / antitoxin RelB
MAGSTTLTVRVTPQVKRRLESVALRVRRSKSFLAAEAIEEFLAVQEWQIAAVKEGIAAADRGNLVQHEDVRAWAASLGSRRKLPRARAK